MDDPSGPPSPGRTSRIRCPPNRVNSTEACADRCPGAWWRRGVRAGGRLHRGEGHGPEGGPCPPEPGVCPGGQL